VVPLDDDFELFYDSDGDIAYDLKNRGEDDPSMQVHHRRPQLYVIEKHDDSSVSDLFELQ